LSAPVASTAAIRLSSSFASEGLELRLQALAPLRAGIFLSCKARSKNAEDEVSALLCHRLRVRMNDGVRRDFHLKFEVALSFVWRLHAEQTRKRTPIPCVS
jgi:hypothetical protein